jgi:hypothetical protein
MSPRRSSSPSRYTDGSAAFRRGCAGAPPRPSADRIRCCLRRLGTVAVRTRVLPHDRTPLILLMTSVSTQVSPPVPSRPSRNNRAEQLDHLSRVWEIRLRVNHHPLAQIDQAGVGAHTRFLSFSTA